MTFLNKPTRISFAGHGNGQDLSISCLPWRFNASEHYPECIGGGSSLGAAVVGERSSTSHEEVLRSQNYHHCSSKRNAKEPPSEVVTRSLIVFCQLSVPYHNDVWLDHVVSVGLYLSKEILGLRRA